MRGADRRGRLRPGAHGVVFDGRKQQAAQIQQQGSGQECLLRGDVREAHCHPDVATADRRATPILYPSACRPPAAHFQQIAELSVPPLFLELCAPVEVNVNPP